MKVVSYLMQELKVEGIGFTKEWSTLTDKDKGELREAAVVEMKVLGIPVEN